MSSATGYVIVAFLAVVTSVLCSTSLEYAGHRCVEEELDITCPPQHIIAIHSAVWGRDDQETCYVAGASSSVTSCAADVTSYVNSICNGQLACDFVVDPDEFDADPCPGTSKYLKINYACEKPMYSGLWCEDNTMRLSCMASDIIHIEDAFFGRDNAITCSGDRDVTDTECTSASVHDVISTHCNNKNSCVLNVNNVTLGEPCLGTYKYLNINFTCSECKNARGSQCDGWSDSGECKANSDWMTAYCRKSCWECDAIESCPDTADDCERLAQRGYCQIDPDFIPGCQYSCNQCIDTYVPPETPGGLPGRACINLEDFEDCNYWADVGECAKNPVWMHERCFQSCGCQLPDWLHEELACEGDTISLNCTSEGPNSRIYSWDAWFGRLNHDTCPSNRSNSLADTDCEGRPEPHDYTKDTCDGEPACDVTADADVLGDECRAGTHKYYVVYYSCRECENTYGDDADCDRWASWGECEDNTYWMYQNCFRSCSGCVPTGETLPTTQVSTESTISVGTADDHVVTTSHTTKQSTFDAVSTTRSRDSTTQTTVTVPVSNTTLVGCSGEEVSMSCPTGTIIIIKAAFYGRRDEDDMCTDDQSSVIECDVEHILDKINSYCDFSRRQHCTFVIGREITDSNVCERGSNPYMEIDYSCMSEDLAAEQCSRTCINGGLCVGPNECVCATGYTGSICHDHTCTEVSDCSRRGRCVGANRCYCNSGWGGPRCDEAICIERNDCSGHGQCVGPNQCWCYPFFSGSDCADCTPSFPHAGPGCLKCPPCSEHGTCIHETNVEVPPTYIGCFVDDGEEPLMPYREWSGLPTTIMLCMDKCNSHAYQYAGLKYGDECYCANSIAGYETSDMCDQRCTHSSAARYEKCGGVNSTSVYKAYEGRCECQINWAGQLCDRCSDHFIGDSCTECAEGYSGRLCDISTHTTETTLNPSTHQTTAQTTQTTQTTQQSTHTSMLSTTTSEHTTSDAPADTTAQSTTHATRTTQTVVHTEPSDTTPPTLSQSTSEQFNQSDGSTTITSHDNLITTDDGLFIAETENPKPHTNILENFILTMDSSWDDEFSYETSPATQMFLTSVGHLLGSLYSSMLEDYITLNITSLRNHSSLVEVSHNLIFNISMAPDALIMHHCAILEHLHEQDGHVTDDDDVNAQSLDIVMDDQMTDRVYVCQNLEGYCTNDGVMTRNITSSKLYCDCRSDSSGDRCEVTETSQFIMVVVAAAAVGFPLLIVLFVCCLLTDKKKKRKEPKLPPRTLSLKNPNRPTMNPNRPMMNPNRPMKVSNDYVAR